MLKSKKNIILGLDPGLADTGYGLITATNNQLQALTYGSIKTFKKLPLAKRLEQLEKELEKIIHLYRPNFMSIEQLFFCNNAKTALIVGQARGVALLTATKNKLIIKEFSPLQVKQGVTGYGQADKKQVQKMVQIILHLKNLPKPDDAADALALAICAANTKNY